MMQVDRREKYQQMRTLLNEKQWRQYLALEAKERGSVGLVAQEAVVSPTTIRRGVREVEAGEGYRPGDRQREKGGGREKEDVHDECPFSVGFGTLHFRLSISRVISEHKAIREK